LQYNNIINSNTATSVQSSKTAASTIRSKPNEVQQKRQQAASTIQIRPQYDHNQTAAARTNPKHTPDQTAGYRTAARKNKYKRKQTVRINQQQVQSKNQKQQPVRIRKKSSDPDAGIDQQQVQYDHKETAAGHTNPTEIAPDASDISITGQKSTEAHPTAIRI
jgi:hypothetical protein